MVTGRPLLRLAGITKRFGGLLANDGIDLELAAGEILGLLGENGAGKTTLMNILFGHYTADEGEVFVADHEGRMQALQPGDPAASIRAGVGMVHQHFTLAGNLTGLENIILGTEPLWQPFQRRGRAREAIAARIAESGLEVDLDVPVARLSVGERQRVELLKALYRDASVLILDEPTAVLTPQETARLFATLRKLAAGGRGILFISHKLDEVTSLVSRVAVLRQGRKTAELPGDEIEPASIARAMVGREVTMPARKPHEAGAPVLTLANVSAEGASNRASITGIDLELRQGEIVGIAGVSGNGQRTLAALLEGTARPTGGTISALGEPWPIGRPAEIVMTGTGRIPEDRQAEGVVGEFAIAENMALEDYRHERFQVLGVVRRHALGTHAQDLIEAYDIRCTSAHARTSLLSGGNMQKLILARVFERAPGIVIANQPTRGLDIGAVTFVHDQLLKARARGAAILLISEDLDELKRLCDRIAVMHEGRLTSPRANESLGLTEIGILMAGGGEADAA